MIDFDGKTRYTPWTQLALLLFLTGLGLIAGGVASLVIASSVFHVPMMNLADALKNTNNANLVRLLQVVSTFFFMALPSVAFARILSKQPFEYIGFNKAMSYKQVLTIVVLLIAALALSGALAKLNEMIPISGRAEKYFKTLEDEYNREMMSIANMKSVQDYIISLFIIAFLPALFEEMLFRGSLQPVMISLAKNAFAGILLTSIFFSAIHFSYYGFLPRLALGLIIGYIFYYSKNLWLASATHFLYNAFGVTQLYFLSRKGQLTPEAMNEGSVSLYYGLIAAITLFIIFIFFRKESNKVLAANNYNKED